MTLTLTTEQQAQVEALLKEWHEAGRARFESECPSLNYDTYYPKTAKDRAKYVCLDEGTSGAFILDKSDLTIYCLKSKYGVPNFRKPVGKLGEVTGTTLQQRRW